MSQEKENTEFNRQPNSFSLPDGYFSESAGQLLHKMAWLEEHRQFPALLNLARRPGFIIPTDYFNNCEQRLELLNCPALSALPKQFPFKMPDGYMETIAAKELARMSDKELQPDLGTKQNTFAVTENYFSESADRLHRQLAVKKRPARVISFVRRAWVAAAALLVMALGFWIYTVSIKPVEVKDCGTIACVDKNDLLKSKNLENLDSEELLELVNSQKLEEKLNTGSTQLPEKKDPGNVNDSAEDELLMDEI